jgi:hypothetical protein
VTIKLLQARQILGALAWPRLKYTNFDKRSSLLRRVIGESEKSFIVLAFNNKMFLDLPL